MKCVSRFWGVSLVGFVGIICVLGIAPAIVSQAAEEGGGAGTVDPRVTEFRENRTVYPIVEYKSKEAWEARAKEILRQILVANGLWPMPEKTPLNAKRFGRIERDGYAIEKVYFESYPGFYVTGNLYLPLGKKGPFPAILSPHGHWGEGRLVDQESGSVPARCINFARQGFVVFAKDMVGYNDSKQVGHHFDHPLWSAGLMGLQTWDSIRSIDFLQSLDEVDPGRIGCTGASGGGTQTFILTAIDDRVKVAVPVCMISASFQGGCECENAPLLRLDCTNVDIGACAAPRPYMLTSATGDWTKDTMTVEGPAIRAIYKLYGAEDKFDCAIIDAGHNYNKENREHVYRWMGKWLLGETDESKLREQPYKVEPKEDMLVFTKDHPRPKSALTEEGLVDYLVAQAKEQVESMKPRDKESLKRFADIYGTAYECMLWTGFKSRPWESRQEHKTYDLGNGWDCLVYDRPMVSNCAVVKRGENARQTDVAIVVHPGGWRQLIDPEKKKIDPLAQKLMDAGYHVIAPDVFCAAERLERKLPEKHAYTYNPTTLAYRVQDIVGTYIAVAGIGSGRRVHLIGIGEAGPWCLLAAGVRAAPAVQAAYPIYVPPGETQAAIRGSVVVDESGFEDADEASWHGEMFQPAILKYGGLKVVGALAAPAPLLIHNTQGKLDANWIADVYKVAGGKFQSSDKKLSDDEIIEWLKK